MKPYRIEIWEKRGFAGAGEWEPLAPARVIVAWDEPSAIAFARLPPNEKYRAVECTWEERRCAHPKRDSA